MLTFELTLPPSDRCEGISREASARLSTPRQLAVIADDDACIRALLGDWVAAAGLVPVEVESGAAAVEAVRYLAPVLAVVDLHLGDSDGRDAIAAIRLLDPAVHVILATAEDDAHALVGAVEAGADEILRKPFGRGALRRALDAAAGPRARRSREWT